jgi:ABC-type branched-subunit amino acid transport system permease subunit
MRDHELAATAVGADVRILRLKAFAFSSAIAAMAGRSAARGCCWSTSFRSVWPR